MRIEKIKRLSIYLYERREECFKESWSNNLRIVYFRKSTLWTVYEKGVKQLSNVFFLKRTLKSWYIITIFFSFLYERIICFCSNYILTMRLLANFITIWRFMELCVEPYTLYATIRFGIFALILMSNFVLCIPWPRIQNNWTIT